MQPAAVSAGVQLVAEAVAVGVVVVGAAVEVAAVTGVVGVLLGQLVGLAVEGLLGLLAGPGTDHIDHTVHNTEHNKQPMRLHWHLEPVYLEKILDQLVAAAAVDNLVDMLLPMLDLHMAADQLVLAGLVEHTVHTDHTLPQLEVHLVH